MATLFLCDVETSVVYWGLPPHPQILNIATGSIFSHPLLSSTAFYPETSDRGMDWHRAIGLVGLRNWHAGASSMPDRKSWNIPEHTTWTYSQIRPWLFMGVFIDSSATITGTTSRQLCCIQCLFIWAECFSFRWFYAIPVIIWSVQKLYIYYESQTL